MAAADALAELDAIRTEVSIAVDGIFDAVESAIARLPFVRTGDAVAITVLEAELCRIVEALSFQDITGQRLSNVASLLNAMTTSHGTHVARDDGSLENGPALPGCGLSQDDADSLFADASR